MATTPEQFRERREAMVRDQIEARGVVDPRVLAAMRRVPREDFVPEALRDQACADRALRIEAGQTISQPYIVAYMAAALELLGDERVLEIGTGTGYAAAVLGELAAEVVTIERHRALADGARRRLAALGCDNVRVVCADGSVGHAEAAPYGAISVAASAVEVPAALREQLAIGGRLVLPVGEDRDLQDLVRVRRLSATRWRTEYLIEVRFVPLVAGAT